MFIFLYLEWHWRANEKCHDKLRGRPQKTGENYILVPSTAPSPDFWMRDPHFHFAPGPANYAAGPDWNDSDLALESVGRSDEDEGHEGQGRLGRTPRLWFCSAVSVGHPVECPGSEDLERDLGWERPPSQQLVGAKAGENVGRAVRAADIEEMTHKGKKAP